MTLRVGLLIVSIILTVSPVLLMLVQVLRCRLAPSAWSKLFSDAELLLLACAQTCARPITALISGYNDVYG